MADDRTFEFNEDLQGLQGDAIIDLWTLDLLPIDPDIPSNERFVRFVNWVVADGQAVVYNNLTYTAIPYKAQGFTYQTEGVPPNPSLTISNIGLEFTALVNEWNDLVGAQLTRTRVLAKHLDAGTDPDPNAHWPSETWYIQQKESESKLLVTFKLSTAFDLDGVLLPNRKALRYTCPWIYRGDGCGYTGPPVADANDVPLELSTDPFVEAIYDTRALIPPARQAMQDAETVYGNARANTANKQAALNNAQNNLNNYQPVWRFQEEKYIVDNTYWKEVDSHSFAGPGYTEIKWNGATVSAGNEYRKGAYKTGRGIQRYFAAYSVYAVQKWYLDSSAQAGLIQARDQAAAALVVAQGEEAAAQTVYNTELADYNTAIANYDAAVAAYEAQPAPAADPNDVCGKRLASCRLRFFDPVSQTYADLPYGGFPGLTT